MVGCTFVHPRMGMALMSSYIVSGTLVITMMYLDGRCVQSAVTISTVVYRKPNLTSKAIVNQ